MRIVKFFAVGIGVLVVIAGFSFSAEPIKVRTAKVATAEDDVVVDSTGTLLARRHSVISFKVQGVVAEVCADVGDMVTEGAVLARLDDTEYKLQKRQAEAQLAAAEAQFSKLKAGFRTEEISQAEAALKALQAQLAEAIKGFREEDIKAAEAAVDAALAALELSRKNRERAETLFKQGAVTQQTLDTAVMQEKSAQAQAEAARWRLSFLKNGLRSEQIEAIRAQVKSVEEQVNLLKNGFRKEDKDAAGAQVALATVARDYAEQQLADTELKAPFSGVIVSRMVEKGVYVVPMMRTAAFEIMDISFLDACLEVADVYAAAVTTGAKVILDVDGGEKGLVSSISAVNHKLELPSRKFLVKVPIENKKLKMKAGMLVRARIFLGSKKVLSVPKDAVLRDEKGEYVFVLEKLERNIARKRYVRSFKSVQDSLLFESGLSEGEDVILKPVGIKDGDTVVEEK